MTLLASSGICEQGAPAPAGLFCLLLRLHCGYMVTSRKHGPLCVVLVVRRPLLFTVPKERPSFRELT